MSHVKVLLALTAGLLVGLFVGIGLGVPRPAEAQVAPPAAPSWEYKLVELKGDRDETERQMNLAATVGFDYVQAVRSNRPGVDFTVVLKRSKR